MPETTRRFSFPNARGEMLAGSLEMPATTPVSVALFAHCFTCSKDVSAASRVSRALRQRGFAVLRFDFTGLGNSEGDFANTDFSSNVEDLLAASEHLRHELQAPELLVGHSLGGSAVLAAASRIPEALAVATIGAPSDPAHVQHLLHGVAEEIERDGSATVSLGGRSFRIGRRFLEDISTHNLEASLRELDAALLVLHSPTDEVVDIDHARRIFEAAHHPKSFLSLDGADHLLSHPEDSVYVASVLAAWASRYVGAAEAAATTRPRTRVEEGRVLVEEDGPRYTNAISTARHGLQADEPVSAGGGDTGPSPYDLLLAALGACTSMTLRMYADVKKFPLSRVAVRLRHDRIHARDCRDCETKEGKISRIEREIHLEGDLTDQQRKRMLEIADRCPVHRTLMQETQSVTRMWDGS